MTPDSAVRASVADAASGGDAPAESRLAPGGPAGHRLLRFLPVAGSLGFLAIVAWAIHARWGAVRDVGGFPRPGPVVVAVALNVVGNGLLSGVWREIVALAGPRLPYRTAAWIWSRSQVTRFANSIAPVGARALLARPHGVPMVAGGVTTLVEVAWMGSIDPLVLLVTMPWWTKSGASLWWVSWLALLPALVLVVGVGWPRALLGVLARALALPGIARLTGRRGAAAVARLQPSRKQAGRVTALLLINVLLRTVAYLAILAGVGAHLPGVLLEALGAFALGQFVGRLAIFAPGGIGPREGVTALVLAPLIGADAALLVVASTRLVEMVAEALFLVLARSFRPA